jgi:hypothetical protein
LGCNCSKASRLTVGSDGRVVIPSGRIIYQVQGGQAARAGEKFDPNDHGGNSAALKAARDRAKETGGRVHSVRA